MSNRRKIDNEFYLKLLFIEEFLEKNNIVIMDCNEKEYKIVKNLKKKMRESLNDKIIKQMINHQVEIVEEALLVNEYNLIWNKKIITGGFRNWKKKVTNVIWKNEILNSEKLDDLFMYNFRNGCIKNLLKEQPTYGTLFKRNKRNTNKIENEECKRCGKNEKETWEHILLCEDNEITIDEIDLRTPFDNLRGKSRIWEILRGVYNENFNKLTQKKEEKAVIKRLWNFIYKEFKNRIWIPRCEEIKRIEQKEGIQKIDLRKKRNRIDEDHMTDKDIENKN
ncbi:hypothetical protein RhiirA5_430004 [Rhizophagus irregularis]|uniref:Uncharacterized protein n=1 Tax=Rhizophagus irregularis TaxID=588596 RepID=A0A2I1EPT8_9GLOM|nr:hypothetical protein RhiirA5_430004 [Rhizophagus irregularis]PKC65103.1 hypothetical protein RhiirA1_461469 [Rhizophagus irregularis]PKY24148.1 hypothetical protein RhiirB3_438596 [Rhizophagus irregularis]